MTTSLSISGIVLKLVIVFYINLIFIVLIVVGLVRITKI